MGPGDVVASGTRRWTVVAMGTTLLAHWASEDDHVAGVVGDVLVRAHTQGISRGHGEKRNLDRRVNDVDRVEVDVPGGVAITPSKGTERDDERDGAHNASSDPVIREQDAMRSQKTARLTDKRHV